MRFALSIAVSRGGGETYNAFMIIKYASTKTYLLVSLCSNFDNTGIGTRRGALPCLAQR
jgi:hypothetical protein